MKSLKSGISCAEIFKLIPLDLIKNLEQKTKVNHQVKKLSGEIVLKLLLLTLLNSQKASLRIMEQIYCSDKFKTFADNGKQNVQHSGIGNRLSTINPVFFQKIFEALFKKFNPLLKNQSKFNLEIYDSTLVSLSSKLIKSEMRLGSKGDKKQIKFTLDFNGSLPRTAQIFRSASELSEDIALKKVILGSKQAKNTIIVFDRVLQKRKTFCEFTQKNIFFVTRAKNRVDYQLVKSFKNIKGEKSATLKFKDDLIVKLRDENMKFTKETFRLIIAESLETKEEIKFITNITDLTALEVTDIYKRRWEIEVFFKFLKQELNFSHLVSRSENGMQVMLWATLILAILLLVFKQKNQITSYKIAKFRFATELDMEIVKEIVVLCGGDTAKYFGQIKLYSG